MRIATPVIALATVIAGLAACSPPAEEAPGVPDTAATASEGTAAIEPSVGSPPEPGGGVPGSSMQADGATHPDGTPQDPPLPRADPVS